MVVATQHCSIYASTVAEYVMSNQYSISVSDNVAFFT